MKPVITIDFGHNDILVSGEVNLTVKRKRSFNTKTYIEIFSEERLILTASVNTLLSFSKIAILQQNLDNTISLTDKDSTLQWKNNHLKISHNWLDFLSKRQCTIYLNNEKVMDVKRKGLTLTLETTHVPLKVSLYITLFCIVKYCELDGSD